MAGHEPTRAAPIEPLECRKRAEDGSGNDGERLVWAALAIAGELAEIRRELRKRR